MSDEDAAFVRVIGLDAVGVRDLDIDAFAAGVLAHAAGAQYHENPDGFAPTLRRLSWSMGWNERALRQR